MMNLVQNDDATMLMFSRYNVQNIIFARYTAQNSFVYKPQMDYGTGPLRTGSRAPWASL